RTKGPEALAAVARLLAQREEGPVLAALVKFLPESPEATRIVGLAVRHPSNPNVRSMLLLDYARRLGPFESRPAARPSPRALAQGERQEWDSALFRELAVTDPDAHVRRDALGVLAR